MPPPQAGKQAQAVAVALALCGHVVVGDHDIET